MNIDDQKMISESLDFSKSKTTSSHGTYRLNKLTPIYNSVGAVGTLPATQISNVMFEIPTKCFNFSKSTITFDLTIPAQGAATFSSFWTTGQALIGSLALQDRSGQYLVNIQNNASNFFWTTALATKDYVSYSVSPVPLNTQTSSTGESACIGVSRTAAINIAPTKYIGSNAANQALYIKVTIRFSDLAHTLFALNKDLFFGQILTLTVGLNGADRFAGSGAAVNTWNTLVNAATATNIFMNLATEVDDDICSALISKANSSGINLNIPYIYSFKLSQNASQHVQQLRLNSSHGQRLLKVYNNLMNTSETLTNAYSPNITNLTSVRTSLNNQWLQDNDLLQSTGEIYVTQKPLFEGSALMTATDYNAWWIYVDSFTNSKTYELQNDIVQDGLDLQKAEILYTFQASLSASTALNVYSHVVVQRNLNIQGASIMLR